MIRQTFPWMPRTSKASSLCWGALYVLGPVFNTQLGSSQFCFNLHFMLAQSLRVSQRSELNSLIRSFLSMCRAYTRTIIISIPTPGVCQSFSKPSVDISSSSFSFEVLWFFFFFFFLCSAACGILVPQPRIELQELNSPLAVRAWSLNHWTVREARPFKLFS